MTEGHLPFEEARIVSNFLEKKGFVRTLTYLAYAGMSGVLATLYACLHLATREGERGPGQ